MSDLNRVAICIIVLSGLLVVTARVDAQNVLGDGRLLDGNLRVGSGGINGAIRQRDFEARNHLITGNVTGLGYFRDEVEYTAPQDFRDKTSSEELFRFRARSISPNGPLPGELSSTVVHDASAPHSFFRTFSSSGPDVLREGMSYQSLGQIDSRENGLYRAFDLGRDARSSSLGVYRHVPDTFGIPPMRNGRDLKPTFSPLTGVRSWGQDPSMRLGLYDKLPGVPSPDARASQARGTASPADVGSESRLDNRLNLSWRDETAAIPRPSLLLGTQLDDRLRPLGMPEDTNWNNETLVQIEQQLLVDRMSTSQMTGSDDVYLNILTQIRNQRLAAVGINGSDGGSQGVQLPDLAVQIPNYAPEAMANLTLSQGGLELSAAPASGTGGSGTDPIRSGLIVDPDERLKVLNEEAARLGVTIDDDRSQSELSSELDAELSAAVAPPLPDLARQSKEDFQELDKLLNALSMDLPNLKTFAGEQQTRINSLLREAEQLMADERYFDAEETYRLVLIGAPRHPMSRVGVIHAQLGAGMIRSAGFNLRTLFEQHPELIATRYGGDLLPKRERLQWVRQEIQKMIERTKRHHPAILLAYLGYQVRQPELIRNGLDLANARSPLDPLLVLLRRLWLNEKPADRSQRSEVRGQNQ